ncbi:riboflavin biosynthesis protein [Synergistales bacterium]|nr:riboflavin biosynthesis protein [Synergistales bacterium]
MIAAIGAFDGFHLGHRALLNGASRRAELVGEAWGVITFENHPDKLFMKNGDGFKYLFGPPEQSALEKLFAIPAVHRIAFTENTANLTPEQFLDYVWEMFGVDGVVVGEDFRFGKGRAGDTDYLKVACGERGWYIDVIPMERASNGEPISSSSARRAVSLGNMRLAREMLGYPFFFRSRVARGKGRGAKLGFPTANIALDCQRVAPKHGVYATLVSLDGKYFAGAANIGMNPTFGDIDEPIFEVNLLDCEADLYDRELSVFLLDYIRGEIKFSSPDELRNQIARDIESIKNTARAAMEHSGELWERFSEIFD